MAYLRSWLFLLTCWLAFLPVVKGQENLYSIPDSLYQHVSADEPSVRLPALRKLFRYFISVDSDSAMHYYEVLKTDLALLEDQARIKAFYEEVFDLACYSGLNRGTCFVLLSEVAQYADVAGEHYLLLRVYRQLSQIFFHASQYDKALAYQFLAMEVSKHPDLPAHTRIFPYISLAHIYGDRPVGRQYADSAMVMIEKGESFDPQALHWLYTHLGTYYERVGFNDEALYNFDKAYAVVEENDKISVDPYLLVEFGKAYKNKGDYETAESYYLRAKTICDENPQRMLDIKIDIAKALVELASESNQFKMAEMYAQMIIAEAPASGYLKPLAIAHRTLHDLYLRKGMNEKAAVHSGKYFVLKDSLDVLEKANIEYFHAQALELTIKRNEVKVVEANLQMQTVRIVSLVIVLMFAALLLMFFYVSRKEQKEHNVTLSAKNKQIKESNDALVTINEQLVSAKKKAEESDRLKTSILENMSHEFRTPLTSILGYTEMMADKDKTSQDIMAHIQRCGRRLMNTLTALVDLAQLEGGNTPINVQEFDFLEIIENNLRVVQSLAESKGIIVQMVPCKSGILLVKADLAAVDRILSHLLHNAVHFTEKGCVLVRVEKVNKDVVLNVKDTGIGMDIEFLSKAFDPFRQASTGHARTHEGIGLGLSITRHLVELMEGRIEVESEKGKGSTFKLTLPIAC